MTDMRNGDEKSKERLNNGIGGVRSIHPVKSVCNDTNVLRPNFGGPMKRADTNTALTHARNAGQTANLRNTTGEQSEKNGEQSEMETDPGSQAEVDLGREERSDLKEE
jgi:hypothetical protein